MIVTVRTTTGRENAVIDSVMSRVKKNPTNIKSIFHPEELRGYVFIEGEAEDIEACIKGIPHVRGLINKDVPIGDLEKFLVTEKMEIHVDIGDIVEVVGGPFKGEKGKVTRLDKTKNEVTVEFLEAPIPMPVTLSINSVRIYEKRKKE